MQPVNSDVIARIRTAFPAQNIQFDRALTGGLDGGEYRTQVHGKTWLELDRAYVLKRSDVLSFLEPADLISVLPVYLCSLVEDGTRTPVPDTLLLVLDPDAEPRFAQIFAAMTPAQRDAVVAVLEFFAAHESGKPGDMARAAVQQWRSHQSRNP